MNRADLKAIVAGVLEIEPDRLDAETELGSIESFDSVSVLTLMIALDERAGIRISPSEASALRVYGDIERAAARQGIALEE